MFDCFNIRVEDRLRTGTDVNLSTAKRYVICAAALVAAMLLSLALKSLIRETPTLFFLAAVVNNRPVADDRQEP